MPNSFPPFQTDLIGLFILLGFTQGFFLAYFFLRQKELANRYFGLALLVLNILILDVWLGYSNLMFRVLWLVDFSEPLNFVFAPALYLAMSAYLQGKPGRFTWLHFVPAFVYLGYSMIALYPLGLPYKYNMNIGAWHPELKSLPIDYTGMSWRFKLQELLDESMIIQGAFYVGLSAWILWRAAFKAGQAAPALNNLRLNWLRSIVLISALIWATLFITKVIYEDDRGDPLIASFVSLAMFLIMGTLLRRTSFFEQMQTEKGRYHRSSLQESEQAEIAQRLQKLMQEQKPFLQTGFSLQNLAKLLKTQPHHLTQTMNENLGLSFFEITAQYRIAEAQLLLNHPDTRNLTIEDIAERVGYASKSAFNAAFKKQTGMTPTAWRDQNR